jgi:hypothetical protein
VYCGVKPHSLATFTMSRAVPRYSPIDIGVPSMRWTVWS